AFFQRHPARDFRGLRVAVRFPPLPEYHAAEMDLSVEIDRGDVWYDFPFDEKGVRQPQPRQSFPLFTLYTKWRGERVPLVRWRTTIGGWRSELAADGQEYYRWKGSDVGKRVWRHIVTTPVWIPPASSPLGSMVKEKKVNGMFVKVTNYDETGPGFLSAYGLVAAIHEQVLKGPNGTTYYDNGIRTHGSFDYMSLRVRLRAPRAVLPPAPPPLHHPPAPPPVQVRPAPPPRPPARVERAGFQARFLVEGRRLRGPPAVAGLLQRARPAAARRGARGAHH